MFPWQNLVEYFVYIFISILTFGYLFFLFGFCSPKAAASQSQQTGQINPRELQEQKVRPKERTTWASVSVDHAFSVSKQLFTP